MKRVCCICHQSKDLVTDFYKGKGYRGGYRPQCKECFHNFPSQTSDAALTRTYRIRKRNLQYVWNYYKENPCVDCGESDPVVLEAHHTGDKLKNVSQLAHHTHSLKVLSAELAKCIVLCSNCHTRRTATEFGWYADIVR